MEIFDMVRIVRNRYLCSPTPGIIANILLRQNGIMFKSEKTKVLVYADMSTVIIDLIHNTVETLEHLEILDPDMAAVVKDTLEKFKEMRKEIE